MHNADCTMQNSGLVSAMMSDDIVFWARHRHRPPLVTEEEWTLFFFEAEVQAIMADLFRKQIRKILVRIVEIYQAEGEPGLEKFFNEH